jgi:hypothetical protein
MKVYVLLKCFDYEGDEVIGVYADKEKAEGQQFILETINDYKSRYYKVEEHKVIE